MVRCPLHPITQFNGVKYSIVYCNGLYQPILVFAILQNSTIKKVAEEDKAEWNGQDWGKVQCVVA